MGRILKTLIFNQEILLSLIDSTDIVNTAIEYHGLSPLASAALGRTLTAAVFMASNLKNDGDKLSITINGDGEGGRIVVCADNQLHMRGCIDNPTVNLPLNAAGKLDVAGCVGRRGRISVVKDIGLKEPYTSSSNIISGELAEDFAAYYTYSEQQPTGMALGVKIGKELKCVGAGGIVMQPMPNASIENIEKAEELLAHFGNISTMIEEMGLDGICKNYFEGVTFTELTPTYKCNCSKEYVDRVLMTLGKKELLETLEQEGKIEVNCQFCPEKYTYYKDEVEKLFDNIE